MKRIPLHSRVRILRLFARAWWRHRGVRRLPWWRQERLFLRSALAILRGPARRRKGQQDEGTEG